MSAGSFSRQTHAVFKTGTPDEIPQERKERVAVAPWLGTVPPGLAGKAGAESAGRCPAGWAEDESWARYSSHREVPLGVNLTLWTHGGDILRLS